MNSNGGWEYSISISKVGLALASKVSRFLTGNIETGENGGRFKRHKI